MTVQLSLPLRGYRRDAMLCYVLTLFQVFFMVMSGLTSLGMLGTLVGTFGTARGAGANIFSVLDNQPSIDPLLDRGLKPEHIEGNIEFKNVVFRYMSRPGAPVLQGLSFSVRRGQSVALVGRSGCGKSTAIRLILRHYDVSSGNVLLDNVDVRDVSVRWLRAQVGLVGQEPVLFNTTVRENIRYGREDASDADIEAAARQANAHHFITKLPKGYQTLVGERGTSLSGGQKQRIAIARALIRNPIILLLDEATSALDSTCEAKVQKALDMAAKGRTTLIVAHRLSTIRNVDVIYVLDNGKVAEQGTHDELIKAQGMYYNMQLLQGSMETSQPTKEFSAVDAAAQESEITLDRRSMLSVTSLADHERKMPPLSLRRLISLNAPERTILIIGCTTSIVTGFALPIYVLCFGDLLGALSNPKSDVVMAKSIEVGITFVAIGFIIGTFTLIEHMSFGVAGASLAQRLRALMFQHLMRQDIAFYDNRVNSTGALCARLSADAAYVRAATGQRIGTVLQGVGCIGLALTLAMVHEWRVALVALAFFPLVFLVMHYEGKASSQESFKDAASVEESTKIAVEAVSNVRTVVSLGREQKFIEEYTAALRPAIGPAKRAAHFRGIVTGLSRSVFNFMNSAALILGAHLIINEGIRYENILIATQSLQLASGQLQAAFTYSADFQKGIRAASRVLAFLNTKPTVVDPEMPFVAPFRSSGSAKFEQVEFSYPTRPGVQALRGLDLQIPAGKTVALVGESGCGKSTTVCLLQRFYDAEAGVITMDEIPLQQLLVNDVRGNLGLVSQEPVLFNRTIRENIAYGDNSRAPTDDEIIEVATQANIHKFIEALPQGYDTTIGSKGVQLSGGQKQRVAIARALVRRPKILLLDEATSALDTESEKVVQAALDRAKEGRTCLMVAHRLSTVRDADEICVFQRGLIVERGTHSQLMDLKGFYYDLHKRGL
ncbi:ATP-dependent translocase ABCB1-like [Pectinophora gossypiella]|uniref:ATP-dependent translocase ABCB1-like n=1 Tax=Pectinophora gossypiella TaxID=13191 RepID=UPI00214EB6BD|nr:ATP-dependent translocase ABCB1-like [Pectinophora gossypiella]